MSILSRPTRAVAHPTRPLHTVCQVVDHVLSRPESSGVAIEVIGQVGDPDSYRIDVLVSVGPVTLSDDRYGRLPSTTREVDALIAETILDLRRDCQAVPMDDHPDAVQVVRDERGVSLPWYPTR